MLGFAVQFLVIVRQNTTTAEIALTIAALPIIIITLMMAAWFVRRESYAGHAGVIALYLAAMAYFIFKLVRMWDSERAVDYRAGRSMLTSFAVFAILMLVLTIGTAGAVMANFGKGLRAHIQKRKVPDENENSGKYNNYAPNDYAGPSHQMGAVPNRMTID